MKNFAHVIKHANFKLYRACSDIPSRHGRISDASLRRLMQRLRDISKRADLQISEMSPVRCIKDVSPKTKDVSEISQIFSETSLCCIWDCNWLLLNWGIFWLPIDLLACLEPSCVQNGCPGTQALYFWQPVLLKKSQKTQIPSVPPL